MVDYAKISRSILILELLLKLKKSSDGLLGPSQLRTTIARGRNDNQAQASGLHKAGNVHNGKLEQVRSFSSMERVSRRNLFML